MGTGPVVAHIVGVKKFQYDIWGDTVNAALRMGSSGEVGQVHINEAKYVLVKDIVVGTGEGSRTPGLGQVRADKQPLTTHKVFTSRGKVQTKGNGAMDLYFVDPAGNAP